MVDIVILQAGTGAVAGAPSCCAAQVVDIVILQAGAVAVAGVPSCCAAPVVDIGAIILRHHHREWKADSAGWPWLV